MRFMKIIMPLMSMVLALQVSAGTSFQVPVPVPNGDVVRLGFAPLAITDFKTVHTMAGGFGATFALGSDFEAGFDLGFGGVAKAGSYFYQAPALLGSIDAMVRYLGGVTDVFHLGFSLQAAYWHGFDKAVIENLGRFQISPGIPFSFVFGKGGAFYFMPEINVGLSKGAAGNVEVGLGGGTRVGGLINLGTEKASLILEAKPAVEKFDAASFKQINAEFMLGVSAQL